MNFNKNSPLPLYYQIKKILTEKIQKGDIKTGEKIPTEEELVNKYHVSRMTIRQAINSLVNEGYLERIKGKGSFVLEKKIQYGLLHLKSFSQDMKQRGFQVKNKTLEKKETTPTKKISTKLHIKTTDKILTVTRIRIVNKKPIALETTHIPSHLCPELIKENFNEISLFNILEKKYKLHLKNAEQILEPVLPDAHIRNILEIPNQTPLLKVSGITYLENNIPIEYIEAYYRSDRYKFILELVR